MVCYGQLVYESSKGSTIGSLSKSVFEQRTSTGSGCFASLGGSLVETLR